MKRLILCDYDYYEFDEYNDLEEDNEEYDDEEEEIIENFDISKLCVSSRSLRRTYDDICQKAFELFEHPHYEQQVFYLL